MLYKWGHPVATLPVTNGTTRHTLKMTEFCESISACGHEEERGGFKIRCQDARACLRSLCGHPCAAPARSPRHAGLPNS
eukprot:3008704-Pleurochrysis_carterae.AAC.1